MIGLYQPIIVAPYAGAWIETRISFSAASFASSPLMRGRGLKLLVESHQLLPGNVAPYAGAWIETCTDRDWWGIGCSRPLCGGVD